MKPNQTLFNSIVLSVLLFLHSTFSFDTVTPPEQITSAKEQSTAQTPLMKNPLVETIANNFSNNLIRKGPIEKLFNSICIADLNGDKKNELLLLSPKELCIYHIKDSLLVLEKAIKTPSDCINIRCDISLQESSVSPMLYITALNDNLDKLSSYVCTIESGTIRIIKKGIPYFFSLVQFNTTDELVLGQKIPQRTNFHEQVYKIALNNSSLSTSKYLNPPSEFFAMGMYAQQFSFDSPKSLWGFASNNILTLIDTSGTILWKGANSFGGIALYITIPSDEPRLKERIFLPSRLCGITDSIKKNTYIFAIKNIDKAKEFFANTRFFSNSQIELLAWNGQTVSNLWNTGIMQHQIRDLYKGDYNNDGQLDLVVLMIENDGSVVRSKPKCFLFAFPI